MTNRSRFIWKFPFLFCLTILGYLIPVVGQIEVGQALNAPYSPTAIIEDLFLGKGIEIVDVNFRGIPNHVGYFNKGMDDIGIESGIILSTGEMYIVGWGNNSSSETTSQFPSDVVDNDLQTISNGGDLFHTSVFEIQFIPQADSIEFNYAFASEEFPEWGCDCYNDIFGFFISGPGINGTLENNGMNIALLPGTNESVSINNIHPTDPNGDSGDCPDGTAAPSCDPVNEQFYNDNTGSTTFTYDGYTQVMKAVAKVTPCEVYTIKLAIADVRDFQLESSIFLEANSFGTNAVSVETSTASINGTIIEGCTEGYINFSLPNPLDNDLVIDYQIIGNAVNGTDYEQIDTKITIPRGDTAASILLTALEDNITEGTDSVGIIVNLNTCSPNIIWAYIEDNAITNPNLGADREICPGEFIQLAGGLSINTEEPVTFNKNEDIEITTIRENLPNQEIIEPTISELEVIGIEPFTIVPRLIQSVCVDIKAQAVGELDLYLQFPNGRILELSTNNGGFGDNFTNTCFTIDAETAITEIDASGSPFTNNYLPEGDWQRIFDTNSPSNGIYKLIAIDNQLGMNSTLDNWSITFNPDYQITYQWEAADSISCLDCPDPFVHPTEPTLYKVTATDSYGCSSTDSVQVNIKAGLAAPNASCQMVTDNSITFGWETVNDADSYSVNVGNSGWIDPNQGGLAHQLTGLTFGEMVEIQIRANGNGNCDAEITTISCTAENCVPPAINLEDQRNVSCEGRIDGSIIVSADQVDALFALGTDTNSTGRFVALKAGTYTITALAANKSCGNTIEVEITEPTQLTVLPNEVQALSCFESNDGLIDVSANGGTEPYTYKWQTTNDVPDTNFLVNIAAGDYFLSVTDANNCGQTLFIPLQQPAEVAITPFSQGESCFQSGDGIAAVTVNGGIGNVNILWSTNQSSDTIKNLDFGSYMVSITDDQGCGDTLDFNIDTAPAIGLTTSITQASCSGMADGDATVVAQGGTENFTYLWNDTQNQTTPTANNLMDGLYEVIATDQTGCSDTAMVEVTAPNPILLDTSLQAVTCFEGTDGRIELTISGGSPDYSIRWSDIGTLTETSRNDLVAGDYQVTVIDDNQCSKSIDFTISSPTPIQVSLESTPASCGVADGTAIATAIGGDGNFTYQWDDPQNQTGDTADNLLKDTYTVLVTDGAGCTTNEFIAVGEEDGITLLTSATPVYCEGDSTGSVSVVASGGNGIYRYLWDDARGQQTPNATNLEAGDYMILVLDENGCESSVSVTVEDLSSPIEIIFAPEDISCFGNRDGGITTSVSGGHPNYRYAWSSGQDNTTLGNIPAGLYQLTITDSRGCQKIDSVSINEPEFLMADITVEDISCPGNQDGQIQIIPFGGTQPYEFSIDGNRYSAASQYGGLAAGNYEPAIRDANGCAFPLDPVSLVESEALDIIIEDISVKLGEATLIKPTINRDNIEDLTFIWSGNNLGDLSCVDCSPALVTPTNSQVYNLRVVDKNGCEDRISFKVLVEKNRNVYVPTGFSPNNDGNNDRLIVHGPEGTKVLSFKVFDRWGEMVFRSNNFDVNDREAGWDGIFKGQEMNTNVFAWIVEVQYADGATGIAKGHSTLIR